MTNLKKLKNKPKINGIVVVEGKTDTAKLKKLFDVETIETNGLNLTNNTISLIKEIAKNKSIILFLDPDGPGEKIRRKLIDNLEQCQNIFIDKKQIDLSKGKIGIAEAYDEAIVDAFKNLVSFDKINQSISWNEYLTLNLNSKLKRQIVTKHFHISECNNKQLFKRLNMMNVKFDELKKVIDNG